MPNDLYYDLSGATNLQNNYVKDLSTIYSEKTNNAAEVAIQLNNLQSAISELSSQYDKANSSSDSVLHHQQEMMNILQVEQQRLLAKKELFDQVEAENDRKVLLNTTYRKKYTQYTKITIVVIMVLIAIVIIRMMGKYLTVFPESLYSFLMIVVISIGIIYVLILYADLSARNNIDYDQIEVPPPKLDASGNLVVNSPAGRSIWGMFDTCKGSKCCSVGTSWNDQLSLCVVEPYNQGSSLASSAVTTAPVTTAPASSPGPSATPSPAPIAKVSAQKSASGAGAGAGASGVESPLSGDSAKKIADATADEKKIADAAADAKKIADAAADAKKIADAAADAKKIADAAADAKKIADAAADAKKIADAAADAKKIADAAADAKKIADAAADAKKIADAAAAKLISSRVSLFTTMAQAVEYGDINQNRMILPTNMQTTSAWIGDTSMAKPNAYLEYNHFKKI